LFWAQAVELAQRHTADCGLANVLLVGENEERLESLSAEIDSPYCIVDATEIAQVENCIDDAQKSMGHPHDDRGRNDRLGEPRSDGST
jgi:hypothetical protein